MVLDLFPCISLRDLMISNHKYQTRKDAEIRGEFWNEVTSLMRWLVQLQEADTHLGF